jgi:hypothetical protein
MKLRVKKNRLEIGLLNGTYITMIERQGGGIYYEKEME